MAASTENLDGSTALPKFYYSLNGGSTWIQLAELTGDPSPGEPATDSYEKTNTDITDGRKTFTFGWVDEGEASIELNYREDTYVAAKALMRQNIDFKFEWTDPAHTTTDSTFTFGGFVSSGPSKTMPVQDLWKITMSVKISGITTLTEGT